MLQSVMFSDFNAFDFGFFSSGAMRSAAKRVATKVSFAQLSAWGRSRGEALPAMPGTAHLLRDVCSDGN